MLLRRPVNRYPGLAAMCRELSAPHRCAVPGCPLRVASATLACVEMDLLRVKEFPVLFDLRRSILAAVLLAALVAQVTAQDWPSFRGPGGSGLGTGSPPIRWNVETGENLKWKVRIPGLGHSSPIVWGDRIFVTTAVSGAGPAPELKTGWLGGAVDPLDDRSEWTWKVLCLDKAKGTILWEKDACTGVPKIKRHPKSSHANSTPATDGRHVVAFFGSEGLYCYDADGKLLWKNDLGVNLRSTSTLVPDVSAFFVESTTAALVESLRVSSYRKTNSLGSRP